MKKSFSVFASLLFLLLLALPCLASAPETTVPGSVNIPEKIADERGDRLVDQADLLSDAEEQTLQQKLDELSEALRFDIVIVTAERIGSRTPMAFADDYFDYNGFGYGESYDGCVLLVSMEERDWWISTCGYGETALPDDYFLSVIRLSDVIRKMKEGDYNASFHAFADIVSDFVREARANKPYSPRHRYQDWKNKAIGAGISLAVGLIAAAIITIKTRNHYIGVVRNQSAAEDYLIGDVKLGLCRDDFLRTVTNRTPKTSGSGASRSGGRTSSGSHTSSSGRSHGGGGGKF